VSTLTVRISEASHQILKKLAEQTGKTMLHVLDKALDAYQRKQFFEQLNAAYGALRADPKAWREVEEERRSMDGCLMDGLDPNERWGEDGDLLPPREKKGHV
jgi:hypothetical protein